MAKERMVNTRIWSDHWVSQLDPIEKLLFLYFLTNSYTNISGVYEMPLKIAAVETGIDPTMIEKVLLRLHPKVITHNGWVMIPNFPKYQSLKSADVVKGVQREFLLAPNDVQTLAIKGGWGEGLGIVPTPTGDTKPNLTQLKSAIAEPIAVSEVKEVRIDHEGKEKAPRPKANQHILSLRGKLYTLLEKETGVRPTPSMADYKRVEAARKHLSEFQVLDLFEDALTVKQVRTVREVLTDRNIDIYRQDHV